MMKMNRKKWLCGVAACLCLTGSTVPVFADAVTFNITIPGDIISKRSVKADDEQKFYVTGTKFSGSGKLYCKSRSGGSFRCYRKRYYYINYMYSRIKAKGHCERDITINRRLIKGGKNE